MNQKNTIFIWTYWGMILTVVSLFLAFQAFTFVKNLPYVARDSAVVFIEPKTTVRGISKQLGEAHVLKSPWKFRLLARVTGKHRNLQPGEYRFNVPSPPLEVLNTMAEGKVLLHRVTFPEGVTVEDVSQILIWGKLVKKEEFQSLLENKTLLDTFQVPANNFEGFLFPDTYFFSRTDGGAKIIETMVARFHQSINPNDQRKAREFGFSLIEWVALASIIEKEATVTDEHPIISSVFHNRLKKRMRLQSDPTVIYGIKNFDGNITKKHLRTDTPYNTYTRYGLTPGPIANPGSSAIHAAVNPAQTPYLYFVANNQGRHIFSKTYKEHRKAVVKYQIRGHGRRTANLSKKRRSKKTK